MEEFAKVAKFAKVAESAGTSEVDHIARSDASSSLVKRAEGLQLHNVAPGQLQRGE